MYMLSRNYVLFFWVDPGLHKSVNSLGYSDIFGFIHSLPFLFSHFTPFAQTLTYYKEEHINLDKMNSSLRGKQVWPTSIPVFVFKALMKHDLIQTGPRARFRLDLYFHAGTKGEAIILSLNLAWGQKQIHISHSFICFLPYVRQKKTRQNIRANPVKNLRNEDIL